MFCTNCGAKINENDSFCVGCGTKIEKSKKITKEEHKEDNKKENNSINNNNSKRNDGNKTASIVLGIISIVTCFTIFISIPLSIVGLVLAFNARKTDRNFIIGLVLNIIGFVATIAFIILAFFGLIVIGLSIENKLTHEWCCSANGYSNTCEVQLDLDDDYTYTIGDRFEMYNTPGNWSYDWQDETSKGDKFKLTLDDDTYTAYVKKDKMRLYLSDHSTKPLMYCTRD